ncbi:MAG: DMT family transporter [Phormidesmis sp. RL_2_1]|nr:DMT family transporter [Phormidesmis sp. RL_2_1]
MFNVKIFQQAQRRLLGRSEFADLSLLFVAIVWGSSYSVAKTALLYMPVLAFLFVRFSVTSLIMIPTSWSQVSAQPMAVIKTGMPLGVILFLIFICETAGIANTSASNAAFLISLCVVFTPIVEGLTFRQFPGWGILAATGLSCIGAGMLALQGGYQFNIGDWLMLLAAILRACMVTATKKITQGKPLNSGALTVVQLATVAILTGLVLLLFKPSSLIFPSEAIFWIATLYLCVMCTLFPFYIQTHMVRKTTPTRVSLLMGTEPVFGAIFAILLLGEQLSLQAVIGGALIVTATYMGIRLMTTQSST